MIIARNARINPRNEIYPKMTAVRSSRDGIIIGIMPNKAVSDNESRSALKCNCHDGFLGCKYSTSFFAMTQSTVKMAKATKSIWIANVRLMSISAVLGLNKT